MCQEQLEAAVLMLLKAMERLVDDFNDSWAEKYQLLMELADEEDLEHIVEEFISWFEAE